MKTGEIFIGTKRGKDAAKHPIIFLESQNENSFIGAVLTHGKSERYPDNVPMQAEYFMKKYEFKFNDTYLVGKRFVKPQEWGPFTKVGQLTKKGVNFVDSCVKQYLPESWDDYINR